MKRLGLIGAYASALLFAGCLEGGGGSEAVAVNNGGSETVALSGRVANANGSPAAFVKLRLRPRLFLPDTNGVPPAHDDVPGAVDAIADSAGGFRIDSLKPGEYNLEAGDSANAVLIPCVLKGDTSAVTLPAATLKPTGAVKGIFVAPQRFAGRTYVQVYGIERLARADSTGHFSMTGLPEGTYTLRAVYSAAAVDPKEIDSVLTKPQTVTDIGSVQLASFEHEDYYTWPHARRIYLNTSPTGADVAGDVYYFPLLVRLDSSNFNFAQSDGSDIRFDDDKGKRLRYEVERWDSASARAEIWVRADVVYGNSETNHFITMYWGKPGATDWSDGREVFGPDNNFAGVWHLAEEAPDTVSTRLYRDAVGIDPGDDFISSTDRTGLIGFGHYFNGSDYIQVPVADSILKPDLHLSVSAWVKAVATSTHGGNILSMGDSYNLRINPTGDGRVSGYDGDVSRAETNGRSVLDNQWHQLAGTFDGLHMMLYLDGAPVADSVVSLKGIKYNKSPRFVIGKHADGQKGYNFIGYMDEAEVATEARSADWIKLSYENQRLGSKLLMFQP